MYPIDRALTIYHFDPIKGIALDFISGKDPPLYSVRTVLYTMVKLFDMQNQMNHFYEVNWVSSITGATSHTFGVGKISFLASRELAFNQSELDTAGDSNPDIQSVIAMNTTNAPSPIVASKPNKNLSPSNMNKLQVGVQYLPRGKDLSQQETYKIAIRIMVVAAAFDQKDPARTIYRYDPDDDLTMSIAPFYEEARDDLKWNMVFDSLWMFPDFMQKYGKFAELRGIIKLNGVTVGKMTLQKGHVPPWQIDATWAAMGGANSTSAGFEWISQIS